MIKKTQNNALYHKTLGFTLIELMVVLVIAAVLIGLALPAYQQYVYKSRRADATVAIRNIQLTEEKYRANNTTYGTVTDLGISSATTAGYYTLAVTSNTGTGYVITASPVSGLSQAKDTSCTSLSLTQSGTTITTAPTGCWGQ